MALDFTALDFETANGFRGSPCSVGVVRVRNGQPVERAYWLMRPPSGFDRFDARNVQIHGITAEQVAGAPRFAEVFGNLADFIGDDPLVAHNAGFDMGVIESALEVSGRDIPRFDYACSLQVARRSYQLASYALPMAAQEAGHPLENHHDALADAEACAWIMIDVAARSGTVLERGLAELLAGDGMRLRQLQARRAGEGPESRATRQARGLGPVFDATAPLPHTQRMPDLLHWPDEGTNPDPAPDADPGHPLFGHVTVFTGNLGIPRQEAKNRAAACGAKPASRVNGQTSMLVIGDGFRAEDLASGTRGGATGHRKAQDALARRSQGQHVELVSEPEFLQMLDGNWPERAR
ncbi:exonuclease domain-containing protein [Citricoccus sp. GCM10030269]|uniref:exonuclease domain-containing protein n=1 Tax=Citricoccus sp. GCM10030269 TaxID=3273388 RepID=UPI00360BEB5A